MASWPRVAVVALSSQAEVVENHPSVDLDSVAWACLEEAEAFFQVVVLLVPAAAGCHLEVVVLYNSMKSCSRYAIKLP